jgi:hypothetical protein
MEPISSIDEGGRGWKQNRPSNGAIASSDGLDHNEGRIFMKQRRSTKGKPSSGQEVSDSNPPKAPVEPSQSAALRSREPAQAADDRPSAAAASQYRADQSENSRSSTQSVGEVLPERLENGDLESCRTCAVEDMQKGGQTRERIAQRAYALYEAGGYEQGRALEHWLEAEREVAGDNDWDH